MNTIWIAIPLVATALTGCLANRQAPSLWPPEDFSLAVDARRFDEFGDVTLHQRLLVDRDGLVIYREADDHLDGDLPVFDVVSEYMLPPDALRRLSRLLERAGMFRFTAAQQVNRGTDPASLEVVWTGLDGGGGRIGNDADTGGVLDRVVRIVNAHVPPGREFRLTDLTGEPEPVRVTRVPEPLEWVEGSLRRHEWYVERFDDDAAFAVDALVVACRAVDREAAEAMLAAIEARRPPDPANPIADDGPGAWQRELERYQRLVDSLPSR